MIYSVFRVFKFAFQDFFRNFWLSLATLTVMIITLMLINAVIILNHIKESSLSLLADQIDISLDFKPSVTNAEVLEIKSKLELDSRIRDVRVLTPEENLEIFKQRRPDVVASVLPALSTNPLGYTLRIRAHDINMYVPILDEMKQDKELSPKFYSTNFLDYRIFTTRVSLFLDRVNTTALAVIALFFVLAVVIIFNTIRMNIYTHREEIGIMKLVGASNWFVRTPFLIEGILFSVIAVGVVIGLVIMAQRIMQQYLTHESYQLLAFNIASAEYLRIFGLQLLIVTIINIASTSFAIRRYLK